MTNITDFTSTPCPKIDPWDIAASFELSLDPINAATLKLNTSWGCTAVDLTPAIKFAETITHLSITPEGSLQFNREDYGREGAENGGVDCITGDELSRIISMKLLKDVDQTKPIQNGYVYMFNSTTNLFEPYDLQTFVNETNQILEQHTAAITTLQADISTLKTTIKLLTNRLSAIENAIYNWSADTTTPIARGNINAYGDYANTGSKAKGIFTHDPNTNVSGDQRFA